MYVYVTCITNKKHRVTQSVIYEHSLGTSIIIIDYNNRLLLQSLEFKINVKICLT